MSDRLSVGSLSYALAVASAISAQAQTAQAPAGIQLVEIASYTVPAGLEVTGAALSEKGSVVFWSRDSKSVMVTDGRITRGLCIGQNLDPLAAAFAAGSSLVEIVDSRSSRLVRAVPGGDCRKGSGLGNPGWIIAAAYSRETGEWVGLTNRAGQSSLVILRAGRLRHVPVPTIPVASIPMTHLRASRGGVLLSSLSWPFRWEALSWTGALLRSGRPFVTNTFVRLGRDSALHSQLHGMATLAIRQGFVQVLADPRTDLRVLVRYSPEGRPAARTTLGVSLGLLDFEPSTERLLAIRRTDRAELVTYSLRRSDR